MRRIIGVLSLLFVSTLAAQPLTVGVHPPDPSSASFLSLSAAPVSYVNLADFATVAGTVDKASVDWGKACSNAFKIVFLRNNFSTNSSFTVVATRGPFNAVLGRNDVTLTPPVTLNQYDLIGVVQIQPFSTCSTVRTMQYGDNAGYELITNSDISTSGALGSTSNFAPGYRARSSARQSNS